MMFSFFIFFGVTQIKGFAWLFGLTLLISTQYALNLTDHNILFG